MEAIYRFETELAKIEIVPDFAQECLVVEFLKQGQTQKKVSFSPGLQSDLLREKEMAALKKAGIDPKTRRIFRSAAALFVPTELALQIDEISKAFEAEVTLRREQSRKEHQAKLDAIEGLDILTRAINDSERYRREFNRMMEDESNDGARPPRPVKANVEELRVKYPRAAAYLTAQGWTYSSHFVKSGAGRTAMETILNGGDHVKALADMDAEWTKYCDEHAWD